MHNETLDMKPCGHLLLVDLVVRICACWIVLILATSTDFYILSHVHGHGCERGSWDSQASGNTWSNPLKRPSDPKRTRMTQGFECVFPQQKWDKSCELMKRMRQKMAILDDKIPATRAPARLPSGYVKIAIEHDHRNRYCIQIGFFH